MYCWMGRTTQCAQDSLLIRDWIHRPMKIFLHFQIVVAFFRKTQNSPKFISIPLRNSLRSNARKPIFFRLARWKIFLQGCTVYTKKCCVKINKVTIFSDHKYLSLNYFCHFHTVLSNRNDLITIVNFLKIALRQISNSYVFWRMFCMLRGNTI